MTGKQNIVFWLAITMILLNFWTGGQSTLLWGKISGSKAVSGSKGGGGPSGKCPPGFVFDPVHKVCVKKIVR